MAQTKHLTLSAGIPATVTLETNGARIEVVNRGAADVWFTTDESTPSADQDDVHIATGFSAVEVDDETAGKNSVVKLLCATAQKVSVRAL